MVDVNGSRRASRNLRRRGHERAAPISRTFKGHFKIFNFLRNNHSVSDLDEWYEETRLNEYDEYMMWQGRERDEWVERVMSLEMFKRNRVRRSSWDGRARAQPFPIVQILT